MNSAAAVPDRSAGADNRARQRIPWSWRLEPLAWFMLVLTATLLRLCGMFDDFWLDEIWSWEIAAKVKSVAEIFFYREEDNNHWLNTIYIYVLGPQQPYFVYRLLSFFTGVGSVVIAGFIGRSYGRLQEWLALLLVGTSYMLIHYSSEARGYAPAVFLALFSFWLLQRQVQTPHWRRGLLFACSSALGFLAHLTFLFIYAGLGLWSFRALLRRQGFTLALLKQLVILHALPLATFGFLYFASVRSMGKGEPHPFKEVFAQFLVWGLGAPENPALLWPVAVLAAGAIAAVLVDSCRRGQDDWIFYVFGCLVSPIALVIVSGRDDLYPRYFLLPLPFLLILCARALAWGFAQGTVSRLFSGVLLLVLIAGNMQQVRAFLTFGRGHYRAALEYCLENTPSGTAATLGSDSDFRNGKVIRYYLERSGSLRSLQYITEPEWKAQVPFWVILHDFDQHPNPPAAVDIPTGAENHRIYYDLVQKDRFRYAGASGWSWFVYRIRKKSE